MPDISLRECKGVKVHIKVLAFGSKKSSFRCKLRKTGGPMENLQKKYGLENKCTV